jgi:prepilin-type N-terminal cleavage/methylation domain-containing protein
MQRRAFTLIELLVVIAIIAILAAILFPVFAQAKLAAKKAVSISNNKQFGLGIMMYSTDYDDVYPHTDGCTLNDSLETKWNDQPAGSSPTPFCNGSGSGGLGGYAFRDNHYSWGKWIMPYIKNVQIFYHPVYAPIYGTSLTAGVPNNLDQGEIASGYALNIAITGAQNTWGYNGPPYTNYGAIRQSFVGGTQTSVPSPADAMLINEQWFEVVTGGWETNYGGSTTPYWPNAFKEHWEFMYEKSGGTGDCGVQTGVVDPVKAPFNVIPLTYCDGHAKAIAVGQFLANSPTYEQYVGAGLDTYVCNYYAAYGFGSAQVTPAISVGQGLFPMWGL